MRAFGYPLSGNVGAGAGAVVGKLFGLNRAMKGGIGHALVQVGPWQVLFYQRQAIP
jgi:L-aminopeptidase/D-esterase-like protein